MSVMILDSGNSVIKVKTARRERGRDYFPARNVLAAVVL
jgi:hypothetical protein